MVSFDFKTYLHKIITAEAVKAYDKELTTILQRLDSNKEMMGWYDVDTLFNDTLVEEIKKVASHIKDSSDALVIIGIGGSYLGIKALIEALKDYLTIPIYFLGTNLSATCYYELFNSIKDKKITVNVISKSGSTLETNIAYNVMLNFMKNKYDEVELKQRIIITTNKEGGFLREEVNKYGFKSFIIPNNIIGRYSVFTPVGLLALATLKIDLDKLCKGAKEAQQRVDDAFKYAVMREIMVKEKGKLVEALVTYEPQLYFFLKWLEQLYAESLGKDNKGLLPIVVSNTTDLHSLGQFIQEGSKILFETVFTVRESKHDFRLDKYQKTLSEINNVVAASVSLAHEKVGIGNILVTIDKLDEETLGYMMQFFMISCTISGHLVKVNPFDQPGVEEYKNIVNSLLE